MRSRRPERYPLRTGGYDLLLARGGRREQTLGHRAGDRLEAVIGVTQLANIQVIRNVHNNRFTVAVSESEGLIKRRVRAARGVPTRPEPIDVAVVHPEDGIFAPR